MRADLKDHFQRQAVACAEYGSPFTAHLIDAMAADAEAGGPTARLVDDWPSNPQADALALRLTGALHFAALTGRDPALEAVYPKPNQPFDERAVWPSAESFLHREKDWVARFIQSPPQTNETRRSIGLLSGFLHLAEAWGAPFDTLELGASAGLNLNWDRFAYKTQGWSWNDGTVMIDTDWRGPPPPLHVRPVVRHRAACDQNPLDISSIEQRLQLRAYIWADQFDRLSRFDAAADLAIESGVTVDREDAASWLTKKLDARAPDAGLVIYHSVFIQYPPKETRAALHAAIEAAGAKATRAAPLAWLRLEPEGALGGPRESTRFFVDVITWPGGARRLLLETDGHVRWVRALD